MLVFSHSEEGGGCRDEEKREEGRRFFVLGCDERCLSAPKPPFRVGQTVAFSGFRDSDDMMCTE